jgi:hypothetical protein
LLIGKHSVFRNIFTKKSDPLWPCPYSGTSLRDTTRKIYRINNSLLYNRIQNSTLQNRVHNSLLYNNNMELTAAQQNAEVIAIRHNSELTAAQQNAELIAIRHNTEPLMHNRIQKSMLNIKYKI